MYLYLGNEGVLVGELVVEVISFQKIFGLCGLKGHIFGDMEGCHACPRTDNGRNVNIELEL